LPDRLDNTPNIDDACFKAIEGDCLLHPQPTSHAPRILLL